MKIGVISQFPNDPSQLLSAAYTQFETLQNATDDTVGWWDGPFVPFRNGSIEVTSANELVGTVKLVASNAAVMPPNGYSIEIGGSVTIGDTLTVQIIGNNFSNGVIESTYKTVAGDTPATIATKLANELKAAIYKDVTNPIVPPYASHDGTIPVTETPEQQIAAAGVQVEVDPENGTWIDIFTTSPGLFFDIANETSNGATETMTLVEYDSGEGFEVDSVQLTAAGRMDFDTCAMWLKTPLSGYNSSSGEVSAIIVGVLP